MCDIQWEKQKQSPIDTSQAHRKLEIGNYLWHAGQQSASRFYFSIRSDLTFLLQYAEWNSHNKQTDRKRLAAVNYSHFFPDPKTCFRTLVADIRMEANNKKKTMLSENSWRAFTFDFDSFVETWFDPVFCVALFIDFFCSTFLYIQNFNYQFLILTVVVLCAAHTSAIKVDFGTRGGPIIPPTSTTYAPPHKPYREPAPVWEEPNDIPNPRPFVWVEHSKYFYYFVYFEISNFE